MYGKIDDWDSFIPKTVGILVGVGLTSKRKAQKCNVSTETEIMLKESMVRSLFLKMGKYKDAQSIEKQKQQQAKIRKLQKEKEEYFIRALNAEHIINEYETYKAYNDGVDDINLQLLAREEKRKFRESRQNKGETYYGNDS